MCSAAVLRMLMFQSLSRWDLLGLALGGCSFRQSAVAFLTAGQPLAKTWVLVKEFNLSYHNKETLFFTKDPYYGSLNQSPQQEPEDLGGPRPLHEVEGAGVLDAFRIELCESPLVHG